jgi:hypothetical protein
MPTIFALDFALDIVSFSPYPPFFNAMRMTNRLQDSNVMIKRRQESKRDTRAVNP